MLVWRLYWVSEFRNTDESTIKLIGQKKGHFSELMWKSVNFVCTVSGFREISGADCLYHDTLQEVTDFSSDRTLCKELCKGRGNCGGFTVVGNTCYLKKRSCGKDLYASYRITTFIKEGNYHLNLKHIILVFHDQRLPDFVSSEGLELSFQTFFWKYKISAGRISNSDWLVKSLIVVSFENFILVQSEFGAQRTTTKKILIISQK